MMSELTSFVDQFNPVAQGSVSLWSGQIRLSVTAYITEQLPPYEYVSSVRAIVFEGENVLVMRNPDGLHICPGGRVEIGESLEKALARELLEESAVTIDVRCPLGFLLYHHKTPKPEDYRYPYPDFVNEVFVATAKNRPDFATVKDHYELEATFIQIEQASTLPIPRYQRVLLEAAVQCLQNCV